jgi:plastocyanin
MRRLTALLAVIALVAAVFAVQAFAASKTVKWHVGGRSTVQIHKGGSIKWVWTDGQPHNVKGPGFSSKVISHKGATYTHVFKKRGTFKIICQIHSNMKTTVKVG